MKIFWIFLSLITCVLLAVIECENGGTLTLSEKPYCECPSGWGGIGCTVCTRDDSCTVDDAKICDASLIIGRGKKFECSVMDIDVADLIGDRVIVECQTKQSCTFTVWGTQRSDEYLEYYEMFSCNIDNITSVPDWVNRNVRSVSKSTSCACSPNSDLCEGNEFVWRMVTNIEGEAIFTCNMVDNICTLKPNNYPGEIPLVCTGGGCLEKHMDYPVNPNNTQSVVFINGWGIMTDISMVFCVIVFVVVVILVVFYECFLCCVLARERKNDTIHSELYTITLVLSGTYYGNRTSSLLKKIGLFMRRVFCRGTPMEKNKGIKVHALLKNCHITIKPGITVLLGNSGSGKSTLANMLSGYDMKGDVSRTKDLFLTRWICSPFRSCFRSRCEISVNGVPMKSTSLPYCRLLATMEDGHCLTPYFTVLENIYNSASLRREGRTTSLRREGRPTRNWGYLSITKELIKKFELADCKDVVVGTNDENNLSRGERVRAIIACQIAANPPILIMDEPFQHLGKEHQKIVFDSIVKLRTNGSTILMAMHNPPDEIFEKMNSVVVIDGGDLVVNSETKYVTHYVNKHVRGRGLAHHQVDLNIGANVADEAIVERDVDVDVDVDMEMGDCMEMVCSSENEGYGEGEEGKTRLINDDYNIVLNDPDASKTYANFIVQKYKRFNEWDFQEKHKQRRKEIREEDHIRNAGKKFKMNTSRYARSITKQVQTLLYCEFLEALRNPWVIPIQILISVLVAVGISVIYTSLGYDIAASQNRMGLFCALMMYYSLTTISLIYSFNPIKVRVAHEIHTGYYSPYVYFIVRSICTFVKNQIWAPLVTSVIIYSTVNLQGGRFGGFIMINILFTVIYSFVSIIIGCVSKGNVRIGVVLFALLFLYNVMVSGLLVNIKTPPEWIKWVMHFGFMKHAYEALMINEFSGIKVVLNPKGVPPITVPGEYWLSEVGMFSKNRDFDVSMLFMQAFIYFSISTILFQRFIKSRK